MAGAGPLGWAVIVLASALLQPAFAANPISRILVATLPGATSHFLEALKFSEVLGARGHEVAVLLDDWDAGAVARRGAPNVSFIVLSPHPDPEAARRNFQAVVQGQLVESLESVKEYLQVHFPERCRRLLGNAQSMAKIRAFDPDLLVVDQFDPCAAILPDLLGVPYVLFSPSTIAEPMVAQDLGYIVRPATVAPYGSGLAALATFRQRAASWGLHLAARWVVCPAYVAVADHMRREFGAPPRGAPGSQAPRLFLVNSNFALETPRALPAGVQMVGPLLAAPAAPLEGRFAELAAGAAAAGRRLVLVAFGSVFRAQGAAEVPTLAAALARLNATVVWGLQETDMPPGVTLDSLNLNEAVHAVPWVPQNDLLGSGHIAVFVSHGGTNSVLEAAYHGVPMVNVPIMADHRDHAAKAAARGYSLTVAGATLAAGDPGPLVAAVTRVMGDPEFRKNSERVGALMRAHPKPPAERAAEWIEAAAAMPPGTGLPLADPAAAMSWWVRESHDVHAALAAAAAVAVAAARAALRRWRRRAKAATKVGYHNKHE